MTRNASVRNCIVIIISIILMVNFVQFKELKSTQNPKNSSNERKINISSVENYTIPWLKNSNFSSDEAWSVIKEGDITDVSAYINNSQAHYEVIGEERTFSEISGKPIASDWTKVHNPEFPAYPDTATINSNGCYVSHDWAELTNQSPSVHWDRNITMPVNMEDFIITSASLSTVVNGTVSLNVECPGDPTEGGTQYSTWDYVRFYVLLSDLTKSKVYEVAYYQTVDLGQNSPEITNITDTLLNIVPEEVLIFYLTSVLSSDFHDFTITLGIRIWCEDNWVSDRDTFTSLIINSCSLNFTYQKKIDQFTSISFYQQGNSITGSNIQIKNATLNFKYKIDQAWPTLLSPNSELRVLINDNQHTETVKLSSATSLFQEAKLGGFDVTNLIQTDVNISVSIQILIADMFPLDRNITVSIDDVYLIISYTVASGPPEIIINSPVANQVIGTTSSNYEISIIEPYNSIWYTLDSGLTNFTANSLTGTINQAAWDIQANGLVIIIFYANNSVGLEGSSQVQVIKASSEELPFPRIPGYNIYFLIGALGITFLILFKSRKKLNLTME